jgi:hypothetical protein
MRNIDQDPRSLVSRIGWRFCFACRPSFIDHAGFRYRSARDRNPNRPVRSGDAGGRRSYGGQYQAPARGWCARAVSRGSSTTLPDYADRELRWQKSEFVSSLARQSSVDARFGVSPRMKMLPKVASAKSPDISEAGLDLVCRCRAGPKTPSARANGIYMTFVVRRATPYITESTKADLP